MTVYPDVNVLYIELREGEQVRTLEVNSSTYLDLDAENRVLGVEVLNVREFPNDFLARGGQLNVPDTIVPEQFEPRSIYTLTPDAA